MGWYVVETEPQRRGQVDWSVRDAIEKIEPNPGRPAFPTLLIETPHLTPPKYRFAPPAILVLPRYVFVQFDLREDDGAWQEILRVQGVKTILGMASRGGIPSSVREKDFERLQKLAHDLAHQEIAPPDKVRPLEAGTVVRILWAPFAGKTAKVEFDNGERVELLLTAAGMFDKLPLPRELIEPL